MKHNTLLDVVVGGQFGSEAKGHVTKRVIDRRLGNGWHVTNIRVAGPNAGHCVLDENGSKFALRSVPVGAVFPDVSLHIAPGSEIEVQVLLDEINLLEEAGHKVRGRITVSPEATVLTEEHKYLEQAGQMHQRLGSTAKGIGAARADRIMRRADRVVDNAAVQATLAENGVGILDWMTPNRLHPTDSVVIEGTQGYGLGLHAGFYPQCTSSNTRAIDFCAMAGLNPWDFENFAIWVVARVYPIRVAGNSGPLKGESSWQELGLPDEHTTVTKKVRRVGEWDEELIRAAVTANGKDRVRLAVTMLDQKFPEIAGSDDIGEIAAVPGISEWLHRVSMDAGAPVHLVTTAEDKGAWVR